LANGKFILSFAEPGTLLQIFNKGKMKNSSPLRTVLLTVNTMC